MTTYTIQYDNQEIEIAEYYRATGFKFLNYFDLWFDKVPPETLVDGEGELDKNTTVMEFVEMVKGYIAKQNDPQ